jgi:hypothetical protein
MPMMPTRHRFLASLSIAGAAGLLGVPPRSLRKIIADGTSWRFPNELKHELKV